MEEASETPAGDEPSEAEAGDGAELEAAAESTVFCNQCGWENPPGARYCSQCGTELQDLSEATPPGTRTVAADLPTGQESAASAEETGDEAEASADTTEAEESDEQVAMGRQIMVAIGGALLVVLGLFFVTQWSAQYEWGGEGSSGSSAAQAGPGGGGGSPSGRQQSMPSSGQGQSAAPVDLQSLLDQTADSLTGSLASEVDSLRQRIEQASGTQKRKLQAELVNLLIGAGHPDRAAVLQKEISDATGGLDAQRRTADLFYRWMQKLERQRQREQISQVARHAAEAYSAVVEQRPNDLEARTRMGESYLLTNNPMRGIKAINKVLDDDSTFVPARFQKGLALLQINRVDQAVSQFEKVKQYADSGSPFHKRAERVLKIIEKQQRQSSSGGASE